MELKLGLRIAWPFKSTSVRLNAPEVKLAVLRARYRLLWRFAPQRAIKLAARDMLRPPGQRFPEDELRLMEEASLLRVPLVTGSLVGWQWGRKRDPRVVLVHGWGGRGTQLKPLIAPLLAQGFSVVAFDAPGHGMTGGSESSLPHFISGLDAVLKFLGPVHALVGHSLGAATIATLLAGRPDIRARAVLIAPPASLRDSTLRLAAALGWPESLRAAAQRQIEHRFGIPWSSFEVGARNGDQEMLVIHDRQDKEVPFDDGRRYAEAWPRARLFETSGLGHRRILADPAAITAAVGFVGVASP